jgi:hypothetical protein
MNRTKTNTLLICIFSGFTLTGLLATCYVSASYSDTLLAGSVSGNSYVIMVNSETAPLTPSSQSSTQQASASIFLIVGLAVIVMVGVLIEVVRKINRLLKKSPFFLFYPTP